MCISDIPIQHPIGSSRKSTTNIRPQSCVYKIKIRPVIETQKDITDNEHRPLRWINIPNDTVTLTVRDGDHR